MAEGRERGGKEGGEGVRGGREREERGRGKRVVMDGKCFDWRGNGYEGEGKKGKEGKGRNVGS